MELLYTYKTMRSNSFLGGLLFAVCGTALAIIMLTDSEERTDIRTYICIAVGAVGMIITVAQLIRHIFTGYRIYIYSNRVVIHKRSGDTVINASDIMTANDTFVIEYSADSVVKKTEIHRCRTEKSHARPGGAYEENG